MSMVRAIPNALTTANVFCGFYSVLASINGDFSTAAWMVVVAGVFDLVDGRIARLLGATSVFGENYDTLSDLISFGVAPAVLLARMTSDLGSTPASAIAFAYLIAVAYRLARFAVQASGANAAALKSHFSGLSSPPAAATLCSFALLATSDRLPAWIDPPVALAVLGLVLGALMASRIPFPSFKSVNWRSPGGMALAFTALTGLVLIIVDPPVFMFLVGVTFVASSLGIRIVRMAVGRDRASL